jgi:hypothetical protein
LSGTSCDIPFENGERLLVYAYRDKSSGRLEILPCTRLTSLSHADEDLAYINSVNQNKSGQFFQGKIENVPYGPLAEAKVTIEGNDKKLETVTDKEGDFKVDLPQAGDYTFRAFVPFAAAALPFGTEESIDVHATDALTTVEFKFSVPEGHCVYRELRVREVDLHATAEVSGRVVGKSGKPPSPTGYLQLFTAENETYVTLERIESDGTFKFEGLAAGLYYLVINPSNEPPGESDSPYPRTYYPGTSRTSQATIVSVVEGAKLENLVIHLGAPLKERIITGKVVWQNGRAVSEALVSLYGGTENKYIRMVKADSEGNFSMKIYGDFTYQISAEKFDQVRAIGERINIPSTDKPKPFRLVIKPQQ